MSTKYLSRMSREERVKFADELLGIDEHRIRTMSKSSRYGVSGWYVEYYHLGFEAIDQRVFISDYIAVGGDKEKTQSFTKVLRDKMKRKFGKEYKKDLAVIEKVEKETKKSKEGQRVANKKLFTAMKKQNNLER